MLVFGSAPVTLCGSTFISEMVNCMVDPKKKKRRVEMRNDPIFKTNGICHFVWSKITVLSFIIKNTKVPSSLLRVLITNLFDS